MKLYILLQIKHVQTSFCLQSSFGLMVLKYLSSSPNEMMYGWFEVADEG